MILKIHGEEDTVEEIRSPVRWTGLSAKLGDRAEGLPPRLLFPLALSPPPQPPPARLPAVLSAGGTVEFISNSDFSREKPISISGLPAAGLRSAIQSDIR